MNEVPPHMSEYEHQSHPATPVDPRAPAATAARHYRGADGVQWTVRERHYADRSPALYFESDASFRRVTSYPRNWHELPAAELESLSYGR